MKEGEGTDGARWGVKGLDEQGGEGVHKGKVKKGLTRADLPQRRSGCEPFIDHPT